MHYAFMFERVAVIVGPWWEPGPAKERGARLDCVCDRGKSATDYASERGHTELVELLAAYASKSAIQA